MMILVQSLHINYVGKYPLEMPSTLFKARISYARTIFSPLVKNTRRVKRLGKKLGYNKGLNKQTDFQNAFMSKKNW